jgi:hypothetical protein
MYNKKKNPAIDMAMTGVFGAVGIGITQGAVSALPAGTPAPTMAVANTLPTMVGLGALTQQAKYLEGMTGPASHPHHRIKHRK